MDSAAIVLSNRKGGGMCALFKTANGRGGEAVCRTNDRKHQVAGKVEKGSDTRAIDPPYERNCIAPKFSILQQDDEYRLWIAPVMPGEGKRLFENGVPPR